MFNLKLLFLTSFFFILKLIIQYHKEPDSVSMTEEEKLYKSWVEFMKAVFWSTFVSWWCFGLVYCDSQKNVATSRASISSETVNRPEIAPRPRYYSINFYIAVLLGPVLSAATLF